MNVLVVQVPPRSRASARDGASRPAPAAWAWQLLDAAGHALQSGAGAPAEWPPAASLVLVLSPQDVAWHRTTLPKAPAGRMRQALLGVLEERLLDDDADLHFALAPDAAAGRPTWVAVVHRPWLAELLQRLEAGGRAVDRVLPALAPSVPPMGHFDTDAHADDAPLHLDWADADGVTRLGLGGSLARARLAAVEDARWCASPAAAAAAEAWLGRPVAVVSDAERAREWQRSPWNLRQFDLAPRHRGAGALRDAWRRFLTPAWRPVRVGLVALLALNLVGLNAWAWMQERALAERRQAMVELLRSTHPQVRAIIDPPLQMARETERLRAAAGQPGDTDIETLLGVAAAAWPDDEPPASSLQFEPGRLVLGVDGWDEARLAAFREQVEPAGWTASSDGQRLTLSRASTRTGSVR